MPLQRTSRFAFGGRLLRLDQRSTDWATQQGCCPVLPSRVGVLDHKREAPLRDPGAGRESKWGGPKQRRKGEPEANRISGWRAKCPEFGNRITCNYLFWSHCRGPTHDARVLQIPYLQQLLPAGPMKPLFFLWFRTFFLRSCQDPMSCPPKQMLPRSRCRKPGPPPSGPPYSTSFASPGMPWPTREAGRPIAPLNESVSAPGVTGWKTGLPSSRNSCAS